MSMPKAKHPTQVNPPKAKRKSFDEMERAKDDLYHRTEEFRQAVSEYFDFARIKAITVTEKGLEVDFHPICIEW